MANPPEDPIRPHAWRIRMGDSGDLHKHLPREGQLSSHHQGRPVAVLSPVPEGSPLERLRATGLIEPATEDVDDLPEPLPLPPGAQAPSAALARLREDER
jgi:hypothetical protein